MSREDLATAWEEWESLTPAQKYPELHRKDRHPSKSQTVPESNPNRNPTRKDTDHA